MNAFRVTSFLTLFVIIFPTICLLLLSSSPSHSIDAAPVSSVASTNLSYQYQSSQQHPTQQPQQQKQHQPKQQQLVESQSLTRPYPMQRSMKKPSKSKRDRNTLSLFEEFNPLILRRRRR